MKYYDSIYNCPIGIFDRIVKSRDYSLLLISGKKKRKFDFENVWEKIYDQFIEKFGLSEKFKDYIRYKLEALKLYKLAYLNGQRDKIPMAQVRMIQANESLGEYESDLNRIAFQIAKHIGRIDTNVVSVDEFYSYLKEISNGKNNQAR